MLSKKVKGSASSAAKSNNSIMRLFLLSLLVAASSGFVPKSPTPSSSTVLEMERREAIQGLVGGMIMLPGSAGAFSQQLDDYAFEPQQQATNGKFDLNSAFVGEYKVLRGMFPSSAGKIASNGPYSKVKDIYKIPGLTSHDVEMFQKYEQNFTVNPPGRSFYERINSRVST